MKALFLSPVFLLLACVCYANTVQAVVNNGDWTAKSTWNTNAVPTSGDSVIIPAPITVVVSTNIDLKSKTIVLDIYGTLAFTGGNSQLNLGPASEVIVYSSGSIINGSGQGSHIINIGSNQVFKGNQGSVLGPQLATVNTPGFQAFSPLPVKFVSFSLTTEGKKVQVAWTTEEEVDVDHYSVERTTDGYNWETIATVAPKSAGGQQTTYTYFDLLTSGNHVSYRIKEVDRGGLTVYTAIKTLATIGDQKEIISIRAAGGGKVMIQFSQLSQGSYMVRFISISGQLVKQQAMTDPNGSTTIQTALHGDYIVQVTNGKEVQVVRQVIM